MYFSGFESLTVRVYRNNRVRSRSAFVPLKSVYDTRCRRRYGGCIVDKSRVAVKKS